MDLLIVVLITGLLVLGAVKARADQPVPRRTANWFFGKERSVKQPAGQTVTRAELARQLQDLAASTPPDEGSLKMGAMCYDMAVPYGTADMICTHCSKKTIVERDSNTWVIDDCQRLLQAIRKAGPGFDVTLDTRVCCVFCNPSLAETAGADHKGVTAPSLGDGNGNPTWYKVDDTATDGLYLIITFHEDEARRRRVRVDKGTLEALLAFVQGKDRVLGDQDQERPLKGHLECLRAVLGIPAP